ncbi:hypothetical protein BANRA_05085 [Klebsiella pneumoniae]|nr:hypothetical protein BANRA_05085 [Klebsiella pneumoniae]
MTAFLDIKDCGLMPNRLIRTKVSLIQDFISDHCCCILPTSSEVKFFTLNRTSESISIRLVLRTSLFQYKTPFHYSDECFVSSSSSLLKSPCQCATAIDISKSENSSFVPAIRADENIQHMINVLAALIEVVDKILSSYLGIKFKQGFSGEFTGNESSFSSSGTTTLNKISSGESICSYLNIS